MPGFKLLLRGGSLGIDRGDGEHCGRCYALLLLLVSGQLPQSLHQPWQEAYRHNSLGKIQLNPVC